MFINESKWHIKTVVLIWRSRSSQREFLGIAQALVSCKREQEVHACVVHLRSLPLFVAKLSGLSWAMAAVAKLRRIPLIVGDLPHADTLTLCRTITDDFIERVRLFS